MRRIAGGREKATICSFHCAWELRAGDFEAARAARVMFRSMLRHLVTDDSDLQAAEVVFGELVTNALRYSTHDVDVYVRHEGDGFQLEVQNRGNGFDLDALERPTDSHEGGRGLLIVKTLTEDVCVTRLDDVCLVSTRMALRCRAGVV